MIKILKHGKYFKKDKILECENCGCTFKYDGKDLKTAPTAKLFKYTRYLVCPECDSNVQFPNNNKEWI